MFEPLDPEIAEEFLKEASELLGQCQDSLTAFASDGEAKNFENFGLFIDRIMGTAATLGLGTIADMTRQGKEIGYKASQVKDMEKLLAVSSVLAQLLKFLTASLKELKQGKDLADAVLFSRLKKASQDLGDLRASVEM
jgi:hypothetical protein